MAPLPCRVRSGTESFADVEVRAYPRNRKMVTSALRAGRHMVPIHGLMSVDLSAARHRLQSARGPTSLTAFLVAAAGRAVAAHPEVHAYRDWFGRLILHHHVDVATMVEVDSNRGRYPLAHLIRDADVRSISDIGTELRSIKENPSSSRSGMLLTRIAPIIGSIPGAFSLLYLIMARSPLMRRMVGTVSVTSVGMFAGGGGFGIGAPTVPTLGILVGGSSVRPTVIDGRIEPREMLDLTITVDHNVVDGAPMARFVADLRRIIESADFEISVSTPAAQTSESD